MLRDPRTLAVARVAAALVAVALSGAPRVLAMHAPVERHRCSCRTHAGDHHECECALCTKAALSVQAVDGRQAPCHRAAARKALSSNERRGVPCVEGTCGSGTRQTMTVGGAEPFCLADPGAVGSGSPGKTLPTRPVPMHGRAMEPPTPRPRAG